MQARANLQGPARNPKPRAGIDPPPLGRTDKTPPGASNASEPARQSVELLGSSKQQRYRAETGTKHHRPESSKARRQGAVDGKRESVKVNPLPPLSNMGTTVECTWECAKYRKGDEPEVRIPYLKVDGFPLVGLNGAGGLLRMHWTRRKRYTEAVAAIVSTPRGRPAPFQRSGGKVSVSIHRAYKAKPMDADNLHATAKPVLDALVKARIIPDDSPDVIELVVKQKPRKELGCDWVLYLCQENPPCPASAPCLPSS